MPSLRQKTDHLKRAAAIHDEDLDLGTLDDPYPCIPPGEYPVIFVRAHPIRMDKNYRLITHWQICEVGNAYHGTRLVLGFSYPKSGGKKWGHLSKFAHCYRLAAGRLELDRFDRLSTAIFKRKVFLAQVRTVTRSRKQVVRSEAEHYSVIETLLEKLTD